MEVGVGSAANRGITPTGIQKSLPTAGTSAAARKTGCNFTAEFHKRPEQHGTTSAGTTLIWEGSSLNETIEKALIEKGSIRTVVIGLSLLTSAATITATTVQWLPGTPLGGDLSVENRTIFPLLKKLFSGAVLEI